MPSLFSCRRIAQENPQLKLISFKIIKMDIKFKHDQAKRLRVTKIISPMKSVKS